ncbi:MAG: hypothetical protein KDA72_21290, partial [Planctomycetales bacterium]|nr:hypothetical protein [Planctomycetales bacterium]
RVMWVRSKTAPPRVAQNWSKTSRNGRIVEMRLQTSVAKRRQFSAAERRQVMAWDANPNLKDVATAKVPKWRHALQLLHAHSKP